MANRKYNWPELFASFEASGLTQAAFCKERNINPKYFSLRYARRGAHQEKRFVKAEVVPTPQSDTGVTLEVGQCRIHCPPSMPLPQLTDLIQALS